MPFTSRLSSNLSGASKRQEERVCRHVSGHIYSNYMFITRYTTQAGIKHRTEAPVPPVPPRRSLVVVTSLRDLVPGSLQRTKAGQRERNRNGETGSRKLGRRQRRTSGAQHHPRTAVAVAVVVMVVVASNGCVGE